MTSATSILVILGITFVAFFLIIYHKLSRMVDVIRDYKQYLDNLLAWRFEMLKVIHEQSDNNIDPRFFKQIDALYQKSQIAKSKRRLTEYMRTENEISQVIAQLPRLFEENPALQSYPDLVSIQKGLLSLQNELTVTQGNYNHLLHQYQASKHRFFDALVIKVAAANLKIPYHFWKIDTNTVSKTAE